MKIRIKNPIWGVPVTFLYSYNPEQFEILGLTSSSKECTYGLLLSENQSQFEIVGQMANTSITETNFSYPFVNSKRKYARILIKKKNENKN